MPLIPPCSCLCLRLFIAVPAHLRLRLRVALRPSSFLVLRFVGSRLCRFIRPAHRYLHGQHHRQSPHAHYAFASWPCVHSAFDSPPPPHWIIPPPLFLHPKSDLRIFLSSFIFPPLAPHRAQLFLRLIGAPGLAPFQVPSLCCLAIIYRRAPRYVFLAFSYCLYTSWTPLLFFLPSLHR